MAMALTAHTLIHKSNAYTALHSFHYKTHTEDTEAVSNYPTISLADILEIANIILAKLVIIICIFSV